MTSIFELKALLEESNEQRLIPFYMQRNQDESGISGTGIVVEGCIMPNKRIICKWNSNYSSIAIHSSMDKFKLAHIIPHPGMNDLIIFEASDKLDKKLSIKRFYINRKYNPKFKSLTLGRIVEGIVFKDGKVALQYNGDLDSISVYDSINDMKQVLCKYSTSELIMLD